MNEPMPPELGQDVGQPVSPPGLPIEMTPPVGGEVGSPQMASPEQKQELLAMIDSIRQKMGNFNATDFASKNKTERTRRELLRKVFEILQLSGVDLSNRDSVSEFLAKLQEQNPQLAAWFESSMDVLLGNEEVGFGSPKNQPTVNGPEALNENEYENGNELPPQDISQAL